MCNIHPHRMPAERVHLMDNNKSHYTAEYRRHTHTSTHILTHTYTYTHTATFIYNIPWLSRTLNGLSGNNHSWLVHVACNTDSLPRWPPLTVLPLLLPPPLLPLLIMLMSFWVVSLSYQQPHLAMWAIIIIIMKNFCSSLYLPFLLSLSLPSSLLLFYFFPFFLPACFSFSAVHFGQVRVKGSHSVYVASTCALPLPLQRTVALIANNNNNDNGNNSNINNNSYNHIDKQQQLVMLLWLKLPLWPKLTAPTQLKGFAKPERMLHK